MSYLYVNEQGAMINVSGGRIEVKHKDGMLRSIPIETLEVIQLFGNVHVTTQCLERCLEKGISLIYYSSTGRYYGRLISPSHVNVGRQRLQAGISHNKEFCLDFSRKIIEAKIHNQEVILRRYARTLKADIDEPIKGMNNSIKHMAMAKTIPEVMGYEGIAARQYFRALGDLIIPEFSFSKRSRRPPLDPFNSMLSLGYSILMNEIYGKLEAKGLNPYFGIMHSDKEKHPTLASDLMEEWRAVLIDSMAMSLINGHEIRSSDFYTDPENGAVYLSNTGFKIFVRKMDNKLRTANHYLYQNEGRISFRKALDFQINAFIKAIEDEKADYYHPIKIR